MYVDIDLVRPYIIKERHTPLSKKIFSVNVKFKTSVVTLVQLISDMYTAKKNIKTLDELKKIKLQIIPLDENIMEKAIEIVKNHKLTTHTAIHVATSIKLKEQFLSFNRKLDNISGIERSDPYIFLSEKKRPGFDDKFKFFKF